jgi:L-asparaginase
VKQEPAAPARPELDDAIDPNVFLLKLIPGTRPEIFDYIGAMGYKGVVIEGFGLGGIHCLRRNLLDGIRKLLGEGVAVLLTTQCLYEPSDLTVYEPGRQAVFSGILQGFDMTSECAVTKMMWALGHTSDLREIRRMMYTDCCGEITLGKGDGSEQLAETGFSEAPQ